MWNWGLSPFPHAKVSDNSKTYYVEKGTVPNSTFQKETEYEKDIYQTQYRRNQDTGPASSCW